MAEDRDLNDRQATEAEIHAYFDRLGFDGSTQPNEALLRELHWRHLEAIPYENLDVQLARRVTRDPQSAFKKLVIERRGGWCYEMNGLFGWMLRSLGFKVRPVAGAVKREEMGDASIGNHLVLLVDLDQTYLADVGLGVGLTEPVPLAEGCIQQRFMTFRLEQVGEGWWRFRNHAGIRPPSFDFSPTCAGEHELEQRCQWLQQDPNSLFVQSAIVQKLFPDRVETLVGTTHRIITGNGVRTAELTHEAEYRSLLSDRFGLGFSGIEDVWHRVQRSAG